VNKTKEILVSWIGENDLKATGNNDQAREKLGPLAATLKAQNFKTAKLIYNYPEEKVTPYLTWLQGQTNTAIEAQALTLISPVDYEEIYRVVDKYLAENCLAGQNLSILLSPGTPAMQAIWVLLGKTRYTCRFYQSSLEQGVQEIDIPFDIAADFLPTIAKRQDQKLEGLFAGPAPLTAAFDDILSQSAGMETLKQKAAILAQRNVPVLIYGETGTGKELFAKAIHNASARAGKALKVLNCGAIPKDLIDATLFGYTKGAFTGAAKDTPGYFGDANGGTLFLDEFGELPLDSQVRLLRVLQDGSYTPVGSTVAKSTDVRIIAATNKNLMDEVAAGRFREDLFYRVAIGVLHLPPLRERGRDLLLLANSILDNIQATLLRATLWHSGDTLSDKDIRGALIRTTQRQAGILDKDVTQGIDLNKLCDDVARHYVPLALDAAQGKKTKAAELLGLNNYQTLENKMKKLNLI